MNRSISALHLRLLFGYHRTPTMCTSLQCAAKWHLRLVNFILTSKVDVGHIHMMGLCRILKFPAESEPLCPVVCCRLQRLWCFAAFDVLPCLIMPAFSLTTGLFFSSLHTYFRYLQCFSWQEQGLDELHIIHFGQLSCPGEKKFG